jgi:hypothetical protein
MFFVLEYIKKYIFMEIPWKFKFGHQVSTGVNNLKIIFLNYTVQQILDDWMLWFSEYTIFMFFGSQNTKKF